MIATPDLTQLRRSGAHLVAAVYALSGHRVSWPLEPAPYDLLVDPGDARSLLRVQVKTCTSKQDGGWVCWTRRSEYAAVPGGKRRAAYPAGSLDVVAIVDGDLGVFLIPFEEISALTAVRLSAYQRYRVGGLVLTG